MTATPELTNAWKPCDLRGVYPSEVNATLYARIARALGSELQSGSRVVVGGDFRLSTPELKHAFAQALASTGINVIDTGQAPTPVHYFAAAHLEADGVCIITASHNPAAHNGLKWMVGALPPTPDDILRIRASSESELFRTLSGNIRPFDSLPYYFRWLRAEPLCASVLPTRIVTDAGNGAWSGLASQFLASLGCEVIPLHDHADGNFPNRPPDCARTANLTTLRTAVVEHGASLGIAWDGDGDRAAFVDENGVHASTDEISILFARHYLKDAAAGERIVCDIKLSDSVRREVESLGAVALQERSGHAFMRARILTNKAKLGLDACGHYFFRDAAYRDDGLYSALALLAQGESLAKLRGTIAPIHSTPELRIPESILCYATVEQRLKAGFPNAREHRVDGLQLILERDTGAILARPSSTEPAVSLRIEGPSASQLTSLVSQCTNLLPEAAQLLSQQLDSST